MCARNLLMTVACGIFLVACGGGGNGNGMPSNGMPATPTPRPAPVLLPTTPTPLPDPTPTPLPDPTPTPLPDPEDAPPAVSPPDQARPAPPAGPPVGLSADEAFVRFLNQPTFEVVSPRPAWRRGTGKGQIIAVIDSALDVGHPEFQDRADSSKTRVVWADVTYLAEAPDYARCSSNPGCTTRVAGGIHDIQTHALADVRANGAPTRNDSVFYCLGTTQACETDRGTFYYEIAAVREKGPDGRAIRSHGTAVASVALGKVLGVAPDAALFFQSIPIERVPGTKRLADPVHLWSRIMTPEGYPMIAYAEAEKIQNPDQRSAFLRSLDRLAVSAVDLYKNFTVVNRSYGPEIEGGSLWRVRREHMVHGRLYNWMVTNLPSYTAALRNPNGPLYVTAAGNTPTPFPSVEGSLAYYDPALRGRYLAVVGLGKDDAIDPSSSRCGPLPANWVASRDGHHFCLAAPYYAKAASPRVVNGVDSIHDVRGTSFSAPIVSGAIALVAEQFRGRISPKEIGRRIVDTARRGGIYGNSNIYGAGVLDIDAATAPMGEQQTGTSQHTPVAFRGTGLAVPAAWGDLGGRTGSHELTSFDERNAPFWYPMGQFLSAAPRARSAVLPAWREDTSPTGRPDWSGLSWAPLPDDGLALSFAYGSSGVRDGSAPLNAYGLSWSARRPSEAQGRLHAGLVFEDGAMLGGRGSGAFAGGTHGLAFGAWSRSLDLGPVRLDLETLWAGGKLESSSGLLVGAGGIYSQHSASLAYTPGEAHGPMTRLTAKQPLRAESGSIVVRRPISRTRLEGQWIIEDLRLPAEPAARSVELSLAHERPLGQAGRMAFEVGHALDAGHVRGASDFWLGSRLQIQF